MAAELNIQEPTSEQCSTRAKVYETDGVLGYAIWYPQMGGYVGKAVVFIAKQWVEMPNGSRLGGCFDAFVWHNGEFPFRESSEEQPCLIHHCDPEQFVEFGQAVLGLLASTKVATD